MHNITQITKQYNKKGTLAREKVALENASENPR